MAKPIGFLSLILHAHLPFVRHPEEENLLEENWLYEAITDTYIPLLTVFDGLVKDHIPFRMTMSLTPPLANMLQDPLLQQRYVRHINKLVELSEKEMTRTFAQPEFHELACMYNQRLTHARDVFVKKYTCDLTRGFARFRKLGKLEVIASCATHGFLPNLAINPSSVRAQIRIGIDHYRSLFGADPVGFWLPECGFFPGVDEILKSEGIRYFLVDSHGLLNANPAPVHGVYAPVYCPSGVAAFARDSESSRQVWSSKEGYPGDPDYREYYRDIGHDLDLDYVRPYIHPTGLRINTGLKYWRITGPSEKKEIYRSEEARRKAEMHAGNFMFNREKQVEYHAGQMGRQPLVVAPYDAELFGHWWFEGPMFLDFLARKIAREQKTIKLATPSDYLKTYPINQRATPSASSWGWKGYSEYWLESSNAWVYRHLHTAGRRMAELTSQGKGRRSRLMVRALDQAARELLLAESSDWPFIMKSGTMVPYAERRVKLHISRFNRLYDDIIRGVIDEDWLAEVEGQDSIFQDMRCARYYSGGDESPRTLTLRQAQRTARRSATLSRYGRGE